MSSVPPPAYPSVPWVESPFFEELLPRQGLSPAEEAQARAFREQGFLTIENAIPPELVARARREVEPLLAATEPDPRRSPNRFQDAWKESPAVREIATDAALLGLLAKLYGRRAVPFQTLDFSHGTEQRAHADTIHFSSIPARFLAGVWVALEDVGPDNGALVYYPGSHRLPEYDFHDLELRWINHNRRDALDELTYQDYDRYEDFVERLMAAHGLEPAQLEAPKGTALIWAAGLVHGGGPVRRAGATRWSQVTHVYFEDCVYYAPIYSNPAAGDLYLKRVVDVGSGTPVRQRWHGLELPPIPEDGTYKLVLDVEEAPGGLPRDVLRLVSNRRLADLEEVQRTLERVVASPSFRLARAMTAPLRLLRRRR